MRRSRTRSRRTEFEEVALPHADALFNFAVKMARSHREAEDLVQDTYLRAYRFFDRFKPGTNCRAWLFRILKNIYINGYRKGRRSPDVVPWDTVEEFYDTIAPENGKPSARTPEEQVLDADMDPRIGEAIGRLSDEYRAVVVLNFSEDLSYREIAEVLDIPIGTVMSRLHRARKTLQRELADLAASRGIGDAPHATGEPRGHLVDMQRFRRTRAG